MSEENRVHKRATVVLKWFAASVVMVGVIVLGYLFATHSTQVAHQVELATTRQPEPITELYFADPEALPDTIPTAPTSLPVAFVIRNLESKALAYTYHVSLSDVSGNVFATADGTITLQDGQSQTITQVLALPAGQGKRTVGVQLIGKSQNIHYWLERL
jgi:hypothetical protein